MVATIFVKGTCRAPLAVGEEEGSVVGRGWDMNTDGTPWDDQLMSREYIFEAHHHC